MLVVLVKNGGTDLKIAMKGMKQTVSLRIRRMREIFHVVDDTLLEAYAARQYAAIPPVNTIPARRVQVHHTVFKCTTCTFA